MTTKVLTNFWLNTPLGNLQFYRVNTYLWSMAYDTSMVPVRTAEIEKEEACASDVLELFGWPRHGMTVYGVVFESLSDKQKGTIKYRCPRYDLAPISLRSEPQNWANKEGTNLCFAPLGGLINRSFNKDQRMDKIRKSILRHAGLVKDSDREQARNWANWSFFTGQFHEPQQESTKETVHISIKSVSKESPQPMSKFSMIGKHGELLHFDDIQTLNAYLALAEQE